MFRFTCSSQDADVSVVCLWVSAPRRGYPALAANRLLAAAWQIPGSVLDPPKKVPGLGGGGHNYYPATTPTTITATRPPPVSIRPEADPNYK